MHILIAGGFTCKLLSVEEKRVTPLFVISGGYLDSRKFSGSLIQAEYKYGEYLWKNFRPQFNLLFTQYCSGFVGLGVGWEYYLTRQLVVIPSFSPGIYWRGKGKDLGCPLEFRSALEISYEMKNKIRIGIQISHVSNAHLSNRNPGFNALTLNLAMPLQ